MRSDAFLFLRNKRVDVSRYLPAWLNSDAEFAAIQAALSFEHEQYRLTLIEVARRFFVETADERGIAEFEKWLKINPRDINDLELRRATVRVKRRADTVMTPANVRRMLEDFAPRGSVDVIELGNNELKLVITDGNFYWDELLAALYDYLPAHLIFNFDLDFNAQTSLCIAQPVVDANDNFIDFNYNLSPPPHTLTHRGIVADIGKDTLDIDCDIGTGKTVLQIATPILEGIYELIDSEEKDDYTEIDWERYIKYKWREFRKNPVIDYYKHHGHGDDEIEPDEPEFFPIDIDFLRLYFAFPEVKTLRYIDLFNPRENLSGADIRYVSEITRGEILSRKGLPTTGIVRALYIHKREERVL